MTGFCNTCGAAINEGAQFCPGCGAAANAGSVQQPPQANQCAPPQQQYPPPQGQQYSPPGQQQYATPGQYPPPPGQYPPPKKGPPKKTLLIIIIVAIAAVAAIVLLNIFGVFGDSDPKGTPSTVEEDIDDANDTSGSDPGESSSSYNVGSMTEGWPSDGIPPGFPKYPNGDHYYSFFYDMLTIIILDTDRETYNSYLDSLRDLGFDLSPADGTADYSGTMGEWITYTIFDQSEKVAIFQVLENTSTNSGPLFPEKEWPEEIPEYPDGDPVVGGNSATGYITIDIYNSSKETRDEYAGILVDAGWVLIFYDEGPGYRGFEKGERMLSLGMMSNGTVTIAIQDGKWNR